MTDSEEPRRKTGYRSPPSEHQFQPGRSGNPRGRPKGAKGLRAELLSAVNERVPVTIGGKRKKVTRLNFLIRNLVQKGMEENTDIRVKLQLLQALGQFLGVEGQSDTQAKALSESDQHILDMLLNRRPGTADDEDESVTDDGSLDDAPDHLDDEGDEE